MLSAILTLAEQGYVIVPDSHPGRDLGVAFWVIVFVAYAIAGFVKGIRGDK
jgi:hypothetical protein